MVIWYAALRCDAAPGDPALAALHARLAAISPRVAREHAPPAVTLSADLGSLTPRALVRVASQLHALICASALACTLGVSQSLAAAQIVARAAPPGSGAIIPPGQEAAALAPLPIPALPIDPELVARLHAFGLRAVGELARLPRSALQAQFGAAGLALHDLACGQALPPLVPGRDAPQIALRRRFGGPVGDRAALERAAGRLATLLAGRLARDGWGARLLTLAVEAEGASDRCATQALAAPISDQALLAGALRQLLGACLPDTPALALRVVASDLTAPQAAQLTLFPEPVTSRAQAAALVAGLSPRLRGQIYQARLVAPQARCPEQQVALTPWEAA